MAYQSGGNAISIGELIAIFREALTALVPLMERARIPWREGEAYDEWDAIAEALFSAIVSSSVAHLSAGQKPFARYGFLFTEAAPPNLIRVSSSADPTRSGALVVFATATLPFDIAQVQPIDATGALLPQTIDIPVDDARFSLLLFRTDSVEEVLEVEIPD